MVWQRTVDRNGRTNLQLGILKMICPTVYGSAFTINCYLRVSIWCQIFCIYFHIWCFNALKKLELIKQICCWNTFCSTYIRSTLDYPEADLTCLRLNRDFFLSFLIKFILTGFSINRDLYKLKRGFFLVLSFLRIFVLTGFSINRDFHPHHYPG
jgi:hypothetical protein